MAYDTRQEILDALVAKQTAIDTAMATNVAPLQTELATLHTDLESWDTTCGHTTLDKVTPQEGDPYYECAAADCNWVLHPLLA